MTKNTPRLRWDWGTGYDLFASLFALYNPARFGIRPAWAAGVRSRIPPQYREAFAASVPFMGVPVRWMLESESPKDAQTVLARLAEGPPERLLAQLVLNPHMGEESHRILETVSRRGSWTQAERAELGACHRNRTGETVDDELLDQWLGFWTSPAEFASLYVAGLGAYHEAFFREEEKRIAASLSASVARGKALSESVSVSELLEDLTQGLEKESFLREEELILVPSFWTTPLALFGEYKPGVTIVLFGARSKDASLVPGDAVPDRLSQALSALSDNTRLRILRLLSESPRTQIEIARALRLRAPTITHHLRTLRLAGLIRLSVAAQGEKRYSTRTSRITKTVQSLESFVEGGDPG